jgi:hypothetical protein
VVQDAGDLTSDLMMTGRRRGGSLSVTKPMRARSTDQRVQSQAQMRPGTAARTVYNNTEP